MTKPSPIVLIVIFLVAVCTLAFTIADHFEKKKKRITAAIAAKSDSTTFVRRNPPHGQPGHRHDLPDGAPLPVSNVTYTTSNTTNASLLNVPPNPDSTASKSVAVNPPHGQPGHVCSVPVGAHLSSALTNDKGTIASTTTTKPAMNPAHGQPGHRCDIAVGAPLNSAPGKTATATTNNTASVKTAVAPGMNPPHGQPGHRCDIAVGAPLNSPKTSAVTTSTKPAIPNYSFAPTKDSSQPAISQGEYDSTIRH